METEPFQFKFSQLSLLIIMMNVLMSEARKEPATLNLTFFIKLIIKRILQVPLYY